MDLSIPHRTAPKEQHKFRHTQALFLQAMDPDDSTDQDDPTDVMSECFNTAKTLESKCEKVDIKDVVQQQQHLTPRQRDDLHHLLSKCTKLFSGKLGACPHRKMDLELEPGGLKRLRHQRACPVPHCHRKVFKKELDRLEAVGVLKKCGASTHAAPTFTIAKKPDKDGNQRVRWASDFRELNAVVKRKVYPLPRIHETLKKRPSYRFFAKLDASMQHCAFELTEQAKDLCVIETPFGPCRCERAPMGVKQSPDFAQQAMEETLCAMP